MAVKIVPMLSGLSTDVKPTAEEGTLFYEKDTRLLYARGGAGAVGWMPSVGGAADPLVIGAVEASDYISVGASPATAGALRLASGAGISWRNAAGAANLNWVELLAQEMTLDPGVEYDMLVLGDSGVNKPRIIIDSSWSQTLALFGPIHIYNPAKGYANLDDESVDDAKAQNYGILTHTDISFFETGNQTVFLNYAGLKLFAGTFLISALPTSDPNVAGQFYSMDAAGLAAELSAGSRYVLVSNGP